MDKDFLKGFGIGAALLGAGSLLNKPKVMKNPSKASVNKTIRLLKEAAEDIEEAYHVKPSGFSFGKGGQASLTGKTHGQIFGASGPTLSYNIDGNQVHEPFGYELIGKSYDEIYEHLEEAVKPYAKPIYKKKNPK